MNVTKATRSNKRRMCKLPIAIGCLLLTSTLFSQTKKQIQIMKKNNNIKNLDIIYKKISNNTLSTDELKIKAKKLNVPFSGKMNGQFYQLKGFDEKTGAPIYYITESVKKIIDKGVNSSENNLPISNDEIYSTSIIQNNLDKSENISETKRKCIIEKKSL